MTSFITKAALAPVAASLALMLAASAPASAQTTAPAPQYLTNGPDGMQPNVMRRTARTSHPFERRPLTVRRAVAAPVVAAPAPVVAAGPVANPITGVLGLGSTVVGLPFQVIGGIFPADLSARKGGVTAVRYEGARDKVAEIDEGWAQAVPVNRSGPVYVVDNGDPTISPIAIAIAPVRAIGTVAQAPFRVLAAPFGGAPGVPPAPAF